MIRSFRSKPAGWRGESYRHYLARKGISTRYFATQVNQAAKGNYDKGGIKRAYADGYSKAEVASNPALQEKYGVSSQELIPPTSPTTLMSEAPSSAMPEIRIPPKISSEPLREEPLSEEEKPWKRRETNISPGITPYTGFDYERGPI
jgi:hypothetical protein